MLMIAMNEWITEQLNDETFDSNKIEFILIFGKNSPPQQMNEYIIFRKKNEAINNHNSNVFYSTHKSD